MFRLKEFEMDCSNWILAVSGGCDKCKEQWNAFIVDFPEYVGIGY